MKFDSDKNGIVIHDIHEELEDESKVKVLAAYLRFELTYQKLAERFYLHSMVEDKGVYQKFPKMSAITKMFWKD